jgi:hypothetical protein
MKKIVLKENLGASTKFLTSSDEKEQDESLA